jgi:capsular polysaccharide biosynthesis protein
MRSPQSTRWHPRIIAQRWRSIFWVLTLLGLFAGLSVHFYPYLTTNSAEGQILVRSISTPGHRTSISNPTGIAAATLRSDVVLAQTMIELDLPGEWGMEGEICVARLEDRIVSKPERKAGLVTLSVKGHNRSEAIRIWNKLIEVAGDEFIRLENPLQAATLKSLETEIVVGQENVNSTHKALRMAMDSGEYSRRHQKVQSPDSIPAIPNTLPNFPGPRSSARDVQTAIAEHKQAIDALESAKRRLVEETKHWSSIERPFIVQAAPSISPPPTFGASLLSLIKYSTIGLGAGMVLAVILAYLLELLFPRKFPTG